MLLLNQYTYLYTLNESKTCVIYAFVTLTSLLCTAVYSYYWPLLVVSWEGSSEKEELSAPLQKSSYYTKCSFELSLLSACFSCLKSAFPPENCFALCRDEKLGEMTGLALDNKEECQVWEGLETYASLNSALCRSQRGMKFLWNRIEGQACKEKNNNMPLHFSENECYLFLLLLQKQPFLIPEIKPTVFSVPPSFPKLCLHSSSSAAVLVGSWELREVPSSSFLLLTTFPAPLSPQNPSWAQCARTASGFLFIFHWLCKIHLRARVFLTNFVIFSYSLTLPERRESSYRLIFQTSCMSINNYTTFTYCKGKKPAVIYWEGGGGGRDHLFMPQQWSSAGWAHSSICSGNS